MSVNSSCCDGGFCLVDSTTFGDGLPLSCFLCKRRVDLQISEAIDYNLKAKLELESRSQTVYGFPAEELDRWLIVFTKYAKVLSPYNTTLAAISQKLICAAESAGRTEILQNLAETSLPAYRKYLPPGHPELTQRLRTAFLNKLGGSTLRKDYELLQEILKKAIPPKRQSLYREFI